MHLEALELHLVAADQRQQVVALEKAAEGLRAVNEGAAALGVAHELALLVSVSLVDRVRPEHVADKPTR